MLNKTITEEHSTSAARVGHGVHYRLAGATEPGMSDSFRIRTREYQGPVLVLSRSVLSHWIASVMESHHLGSSANWDSIQLVTYPSWTSVDTVDFQVEANRQSDSVFQDIDKYQFEHGLLDAFEEEVIEDGMYHPAEDIISDAFENHDEAKVLGWIHELVLDTSRPDLAYSILLCLTHQQPPGTSSWRLHLISGALGSKDIVVRDAAVQVAESWADPALLPVLRAQKDNETATWLKNYLQHVIECIQTPPLDAVNVSCS